MKKIAEYLRTQAAALTAMADADNLKGKYADELAENARGLGRKLDEAEDRYREVKVICPVGPTNSKSSRRRPTKPSGTLRTPNA